MWTNRRLEWIERDRQTLAESRGNSTPASVGTSLPDVVFDVMARTDQDLLSAGRSSSECRSVSLEHRKRSISIESTSRARSLDRVVDLTQRIVFGVTHTKISEG